MLREVLWGGPERTCHRAAVRANDSPMLERVLFHALEYLADSVCVHEVENHRSEGVALTYSSFGRENAAVRQDELVVHCVMRGEIWKQLGGILAGTHGIESVHEVKRQAGVFWEGIEVRSDPVGAGPDAPT